MGCRVNSFLLYSRQEKARRSGLLIAGSCTIKQSSGQLFDSSLKEHSTLGDCCCPQAFAERFQLDSKNSDLFFRIVCRSCSGYCLSHTRLLICEEAVLASRVLYTLTTYKSSSIIRLLVSLPTAPCGLCVGPVSYDLACVVYAWLLRIPSSCRTLPLASYALKWYSLGHRFQIVFGLHDGLSTVVHCCPFFRCDAAIHHHDSDHAFEVAAMRDCTLIEVCLFKQSEDAFCHCQLFFFGHLFITPSCRVALPSLSVVSSKCRP
ncbi:hypothetical protein ISREJYDI_CDS0028 [Pseudomonas phage UNO-G1W1]|uniref:Uncharacterized protein n=1 Tax=Pseudomonas phage UNO-G1W1 TaxID=3136609 RepID=A0AAX4QMM0_9CAUD